MQIKYSINIMFGITSIGLLFVFDDDHLIGLRQLLQTPNLLLTLFFQLMIMVIKNELLNVTKRIIMKSSNKLLNWYEDVENRLSFEEYEDPNQTFTVD